MESAADYDHKPKNAECLAYLLTVRKRADCKYSADNKPKRGKRFVPLVFFMFPMKALNINAAL